MSQTKSYGRPSPTDWTTKPITPARVEEMRKSLVAGRIEADVRKLKEKLFDHLGVAHDRYVSFNASRGAGQLDVSPEAVEVFVAELKAQGFQVVHFTDLTRLNYGEIQVRWSV